MKVKFPNIISLIILSFFLPAVLGFTLIHHNCLGCQSSSKETAFIIVNHSHEDSNYNCCSANTSDTCHSQNDANNCCSKSQCEHECKVDLVKIDEPFTSSIINNFLPIPIEVELVLLQNNLRYSKNLLISNSAIKKSDVTAHTLSGIDLFIRHETFLL